METVNRADNGITNFQSLDLISKLNLERSFWLLSQTGKSNWNILPGDSALLEVFKRKLCSPSTIYSSSFFSPLQKFSAVSTLWTEQERSALTFRGRKTMKARLQTLFLLISLHSQVIAFIHRVSFLCKESDWIIFSIKKMILLKYHILGLPNSPTEVRNNAFSLSCS